MKPGRLNSATDYHLALLWLMDRLQSARASEATAAFGEEFGAIIPAEHREVNESGRIKWEHYVAWSRLALVRAGLMGSGGRGVWAITPQGKAWLREHPDADAADLAAFIRQGGARVESGFRWQGEHYTVTKQVGEAKGSIPAPVQRLKGASRVERRDEFLAQVAEHLSSSVPGQANQGETQFVPGRNCLQIAYAEFPRSHYELRLTRGFDEVAFHLEGDRDDNLARLAMLAPHQKELAAVLGHSVVAERWGQNWARLAIDLPSAPWTGSQAQKYATLLARFVGATYPFVEEAFVAVPGRQRSRTKKPVPTGSAEGRPHAILDQQLAQIRTFLQGRSSRPSDEVLCDWVQFCYNFELFNEGYELFKLIVPSAVNDWLYGRTKKLAQVCRMRGMNRSMENTEST